MNPTSSKRSNTPLILILLLCLAPVVAALVVYYVPDLQPEGSTNYGELVQPQRPMPSADDLKLTTLDGKPYDLNDLKGQWLLLAADGGACPESCAKKLFIMRNTHAMLGKNVKRMARVWFITDDAPVPQAVLDAYQGTIILRADPKLVDRFLAGQDVSAATDAAIAEPIWVIDPLGNLMMSYPKDPDPLKVRKDLGKLLHNSQIG